MSIGANVMYTIAAALGIIMVTLGLPGNTLLLIVYVIYALMGDFQHVTLNQLAVVAAIYLLGEVWEFAVGYFGIKKEKITWLSVIIIGIGGFAGAVAGTAVMPVLGSVIGSALGASVTAFFVEYFSGKDDKRAVRLAWIAARNQFIGLIGKIVFGMTIFIMFIRTLWNI